VRPVVDRRRSADRGANLNGNQGQRVRSHCHVATYRAGESAARHAAHAGSGRGGRYNANLGAFGGRRRKRGDHYVIHDGWAWSGSRLV